MKTKLTLLLLFFCLLPMAAQVAEDDQHWTDEEVLKDVSVGKSTDNPRDVLVSEDNTTFTIYTAKGLAWVAKVTNDELKYEDGNDEAKYYPAEAGFKDCTVELGDIAGGKLDISGHKWVPIGYDDKYFKGTFDGKSQEIIGLRIEEILSSNIYFYGLFGYIYEAEINNLGIQIKTFSIDKENKESRVGVLVGGIAGYIYNVEISNCYVYGKEKATIQVKNVGYCFIGGLVGNNYQGSKNITNSYSMIDIIASSNKANCIGGIVGYSIGTLSNSFATGSIVVNSPEEESYIGGICGLSQDATLKNNLALNKGGITVTNDKGVTVNVGYICGENDESTADNYVSSNFAIKGDNITDNDDNEGKIIGSETDLAAILNGGSSSDNAWFFPEGGGLPCLNAFGEKSQPAASADKKDFEVGELELKDDITKEEIICLRYEKGSGWWQTNNSGTHITPFNGKISETDITKGVYITGVAVGEDVPTLTVVGNLEIETEGVCGMSINKSVNLNIVEGMKLNISGNSGLEIDGNLTLNQSPSKSRDTGNGGITITGTEENGIGNRGILNINVNKQTIEVNGNIKNGITNSGTINCNTGSIKINGDFGIANVQEGNFNIQGAVVTINQYIEVAIDNYGAFSISPTGTLNILTKDGSQPIIHNYKGSTFKLEPGATFKTGKSGVGLPNAYTLTYSSTKGETISITDEYGINYQSGSNLCAGTKLTVTVSGNTKDIENVIYTQAGGSAANATYSDIDGTYTFTMPELATEVSVKFKADPEPEPEPDDDDDDSGVVTPTVYYTVTLPEVEGATLDPGAGDYDVESWNTFRFYLTLAPEYDQSLPIVTTDRGETIAPRQSDGAYLVKYVRTNVAITIDGIVKNPDPVANDAVDADNITIRRTADGLLIHVPSPETLTLYTFAGTLVRTIHLPAGDTRIDVPTGTYIVRVGTKVEKVII